MEETNIPLVTSITPSNAYFDDMNAIHDVKSFVKKFHYESKKLWYLAGPAIFTYVPLPILNRCCYSNLCWSCWNHLTYCCFYPNPCYCWIFRGNTVGNGKRIGMIMSKYKRWYMTLCIGTSV
ncbi:hypothetical protein AABB24_039929 [Solanum stoloniferum]|uniref:Uncharacterized protein n=1 Tax=Solanum stoloniferum TaxID=62892 RepID=A0ABD2QSR7_9SOLN